MCCVNMTQPECGAAAQMLYLHLEVQFGGFKLLFYKSLDPEEFQDESRQCGEWNSSNIAASCMILT